MFLSQSILDRNLSDEQNILIVKPTKAEFTRKRKQKTQHIRKEFVIVAQVAGSILLCGRHKIKQQMRRQRAAKKNKNHCGAETRLINKQRKSHTIHTNEKRITIFIVFP